jgi:anti-sigma factor RsiW
MPPDPSTPREQARESSERLESMELLWDALRRRLDPYVPDGTLGAALRSVSREARTRGHGVPEVLRELRRVWEGLPRMQRAATPEERARVLERLIAICLEEYYGES